MSGNIGYSSVLNRLNVPSLPNSFPDAANNLIGFNQLVSKQGPILYTATTAQLFFNSKKKIPISDAVFNNPTVLNNFLLCFANFSSSTQRFVVWKKPPGDARKRVNTVFNPLGHPVFASFVLGTGRVEEVYVPTEILIAFSSANSAVSNTKLSGDLKTIGSYRLNALRGTFTYRVNPSTGIEEVYWSNDLQVPNNTIRIYNTLVEKELYINVYVSGKPLHKPLVVQSSQQVAEIYYDQIYLVGIMEESATGEVVYSPPNLLSMTVGNVCIAFDPDTQPLTPDLRIARTESYAVPISSAYGNMC